MELHPTARKEENVLINDTLNTLYLRLYGVRLIVKDYSAREETFLITSKGSVIYVIPQNSTYHGCRVLAGMTNSSMGSP